MDIYTRADEIEQAVSDAGISITDGKAFWRFIAEYTSKN